MKKRFCKICEKEIGIYEHPGRKYCSTPCKNASRRRSADIKKQQNMFKNPKQKCRRCSIMFNRIPEGHRYYCSNCIHITKNGTEIHKCMDCSIEITQLRKRCEPCAAISKTKQVEEKNKEIVRKSKKIQEQNKKNKKENKTNGIHPRYLERNYSGNKFSTQGAMNSFGVI